MPKRIFYLDFIKVLAMFMVVFNHTHNIISSQNMIVFIIHYFLFYFSKCAVPLFFMISGALLIGRNDSYKKIVKRIIRVVIPMILIFLIWVLLNKKFYFDSSFFPYWLWYLMALIAVYLFLPFINKMIKNLENKDYKIFFFIFLIIPSIFYTIDIIYDICIQKQSIFNNELINNLITMPIAYFMLGYYLNNKIITKKMKNCGIILLLVVLSIETLIAVMLKRNNMMFFFLDNYKSVFVSLMSPTLFIIVKYYFKNYTKKNEFSMLVSNLANNSFLIYLFHVIVIKLLLLTPFFKELVKFNSLEAAFVIVVITICLLDIMFTILKHIPILKNVLNKYFG